MSDAVLKFDLSCPSLEELMKIDLLSLEKALKVLAELKKERSYMSLNEAIVFLTVAKFEGATVKEIGKQAGMTKATASRMLIMLSKGSQARKLKGIDLVERFEDDSNMILTRVKLSPKGRALMDQVMSK